MTKKNSKISGKKIFGLICLVCSIIVTGLMVYSYYMSELYDYPTNIQKALTENRFEKAYKITDKWTKYKASKWFTDKEKAKIKSYKERILPWQTRYLLKHPQDTST